jgi:hypothetical protein
MRLNVIDRADHLINLQDTRESRNPDPRGLGKYYFLIPDFKDVMLERSEASLGGVNQIHIRKYSVVSREALVKCP